MLVVLDTNIIVSALLSPSGNPASVLSLAMGGRLSLCYDARIIAEYEQVLKRPKFQFDLTLVSEVLSYIERYGISVIPKALIMPFVDPEDKKFFEVAKYCHAKLITGNLKHFPEDECIITAADFINIFGWNSKS